jgi:predicted HicB family RNase H-like nuclease
MKYEFEVYQMNVEGHLFWVAKSKSLKGCVGQGDTAEEAVKELSINEDEWISAAVECNIPVPPVTVKSESAYSGKVSLRFSPFMHEQAADNAKQQGISLNQYINDAITFYNSMIIERNFHKSSGSAAVLSEEISSVIQFESKQKKTSANISFTDSDTLYETDILEEL